MLSYPGEQPFVAGGRLINCYPEPLPQSAGKPNAYWRVPGLGSFATTPSGTYRGGVLVAGIFYAVFGSTVYAFTSAGGAGTALSGSIAGSSFCWCAGNQNSPADVVIVSPGVAAYWFSSGASSVSAYPDVNIGVPNCVTYMSGMFVFTYGNGLSQVTNTNVTTINPLNFANAQSKPDALYRPIALNNSNLLLAGSNTMEVWGSPINPTGYPFSYIQTIYRGIPNPSAIAGDEDGWGKGLFFIGDDNRVSTLTTYTPTPISILEIDRLIENEPDKTKVSVGVYNSRGHGFVVVQGPKWCWVYDTTLQTWHERQSYLQTFWRGIQPKYLNFGTNSMWVCGDQLGPNLLQISGSIRNELGNPLRMRLETGPIGAFPRKVRVNEIELFMTKGASIATGHSPDETNAMVEISISRDAGQTWSSARQVAIGQQSVMGMRARASIWGQAAIEGVRWRFDESAGLDFAFMGADMKSDTLR